MLLAMIYQRWDNVMETGILSDYFPWAVDTRQSVQERNLCEKCPRYPALQKIRTIYFLREENIKFNGIKLGARVNFTLSNANTFRFCDPFVKGFLVKPKLGSQAAHSLSQDHGVTQSFGFD